jgi:dUTP pyrophosphatase
MGLLRRSVRINLKPRRKMDLIKAKKLDSEAVIPTKSHQSDAGWDLYALEDGQVEPKDKTLIKTGVSLEIPTGFVGLIWPRSGLAVKSGIDVFAGVVDSGYRGDVGVCLYNSSGSIFKFKKGDRIAQILFQEIPNFKIQEVTELDCTPRCEEGFGSSGS